ncbi:MAG: FAD-dependent oxidoreductase [SAR324 cluster bacterium]|nr:FAD-dependent oxidoreductase [SAR324 cluster bacterium]
MNSIQTDTIVIGGGIIGVSLAYGLIKHGSSVILLDREDQNLTASRANFGLVWVQSKGYGMPRYAEWCIEATDHWPVFSESLEEETGSKLNYENTGGFEICLGEEELAARVKFIEDMRMQSRNGQYEVSMLSRDELQKMLPKIALGNDVSGASFCRHDGIVDPLNLLRTFYQGFQKRGGDYRPGHWVEDIQKDGSGFLVKTPKQHFRAQKLVIASGLATTKLSNMVGMAVPVSPQKGQVLVTERTSKLFPFATGGIRQNANGNFMFGASHEDTGIEIGTSTDILKVLVSRALRIFPVLENLQLVRTWAGLRVLTPDQKPVYCESEEFPGAFAVTSHSGVSLASLHSDKLPEWILEGKIFPDFDVFHPRRFNV